VKKDPTECWRKMYGELVARGKSKKRAIVAVANRLARVAYAVLRDQRSYEARERRCKEEVSKTQEPIHPIKTLRSTTP